MAESETYQGGEPQIALHDLSTLGELHGLDNTIRYTSVVGIICNSSSVHRERDLPVVIAVTQLRTVVECHADFKFLRSDRDVQTQDYTYRIILRLKVSICSRWFAP